MGPAAGPHAAAVRRVGAVNTAVNADDFSIFPASFAQRRLWFIQAMFPDSTAYTMVFQAEFGFVTDPVRLQTALDRLIHRHESLRTAFGLSDGEPVQIIARTASATIETIDLRGARNEAEFAARITGWLARPST